MTRVQGVQGLTIRADPGSARKADVAPRTRALDDLTADQCSCVTGRGAHWIQYATDSSGSPIFARPAPAYRDVDTPKQHVSRVAQAQHSHKLMTPKKLNSLMTKNAALLQEHAGIDTVATRYIWNTVRAWELRIAVRIRVNRLHTTCRHHLSPLP